MIAEIEDNDELRMPAKAFFNSLSDDFQRIDNLLADGVFAAYLLGYDEAREENLEKIEAAQFAEGDGEDLAEKAGPIDLRFDVPPKEAIDYFKRKKIFSKKELAKLEAEARAAAFTVGEVYEEQVLEAFKSEILDALENGTPVKTVVKNFRSILSGSGHKMLGNFHLETVARTNMMRAYGVGHRRQMEEVSDLLPFWEYSAVMDDRTRPTHRACDGVILPANNPFWNTHYPPWGFNCRCRVIARLDIPESYDITQPNPDTQLVTDADGVPIKASYGTGVYNLDAGKFEGIPAQAGMKNPLNAVRKKQKN